MSIEGGNFEGGGVLPPSSEDYRRMWEEQSKTIKPNEFKRQAEENKRKARREVFQEQVRKAVEVKNPKLTETFFANINVTERR